MPTIIFETSTSHNLTVERRASGTIETVVMPRPSNFHAHLRRDELMQAIAPHIMRCVRYLLVMPNTGPIRTMADAQKYYEELVAITALHGFEGLRLIMTLYHTAGITAEVIEQIAASDVVRAIKHYPPEPGVTTGSGLGIPLWEKRSHDQLDVMEKNGVPLLGHFESAHDKRNRPLHPREGEAYYITNYLWEIRDKHPNLKICVEHASTKEAVEFVKADTSGNTVLTGTPHHALCEESIFARSWATHAKCKPILQTPKNRDSIVEFITSGDRRAIAGDDTAAHLSETKRLSFEKAANGCFWVSHGIAAYAAVFEKAGRLDNRFTDFMCLNGPRWWKLPPPDDTIKLRRETERDIPEPVNVPEKHDEVIPFGWSSEADRLQLGLMVE